jgi:hypothetical protein
MKKIAQQGFWPLLLVVASVCGCATQFMGNAKIAGGKNQCLEICKAWDMELTGMVAMGEYTNGCICQVPAKTSASRDAATTAAAGEAAAAAAVMVVKRTRDMTAAAPPIR